MRRRDEVLDTAKSLISGDREEAYGDVVNSWATIAEGWSAILGAPVTPRQVGQMMIWLKVARSLRGPQVDNFVDIAGYAALAAEVDERLG